VARIRPEVHLEQQIARLALADPRTALPAEAHYLAFLEPLGDLHVEGARLEHDTARVVHFRRPQRDLPGGSAVHVLQVDQDPGVMVLAARVARTAPEAAGARSCAAAHAPEQLCEEIAEVAVVARPGARRAPTRELEAGIPVRWRTEILPGLIALAQLVVGRALFGIRQDRVGLVDLLHARVRIGLLGYVRVVLARELAERLLDLVRGRFLGYAQGRVVILEIHCALRKIGANPAPACIEPVHMAAARREVKPLKIAWSTPILRVSPTEVPPFGH